MTVICDWCREHGDFPSFCFAKKCGVCGQHRCSRHRIRLSHSFSGRTVYICHDNHLDETIGGVLDLPKRW